MIRLVPFALLFAVGCSQDFGLQSFEPEDAYGTDRPEDAEQDTAAPEEPEDTDWGVDTGFEPPEEEEEPVEEEPVEEEPE